MKKLAEERGEDSSIDYPCTRIELLYKPDPPLLVADLSLLQEHEPFGGMARYKITFKEADPQWTRSKLQRYMEFVYRCERDNFWITKRAINRRSNNFAKQYGDFYELEECRPTLDEMFQHGIRGFFPQ